MSAQLLLGVDVGSTTVKAVAVDASTDAIIWSDYQRHETKQPEKTLEFLGRIEAELGINAANCRVFITGSGGSTMVRNCSFGSSMHLGQTRKFELTICGPCHWRSQSSRS